MTVSKKIIAKNIDDTLELGRRLGKTLRGGDVVALTGELGAGKTVLVRGIVEGAGIDPRSVTSPTFVIMNIYAGETSICHIDAYRLGGATDLEEIGVRDFFNPQYICVVEWAERVAAAMPSNCLRVEIRILPDDSRELIFESSGEPDAGGYSAFL